jgi:hypothetical protein
MIDETELSAARLAQRRDHLMTAIDTLDATQPSRTRRRVIAAASSIAVLLAGGGAVAAVAGSPAVFRQSNGVVAVDASQLHKNAYEGREITQAQLQQLNAEGKATHSLITREGACHGDILLFDTDAELTAFETASMARRQAAEAAGEQDPCAFAANLLTGPGGMSAP